MSPRPPTSTLFHSPTLFRSPHPERVQHLLVAGRLRVRRRVATHAVAAMLQKTSHFPPPRRIQRQPHPLIVAAELLFPHRPHRRVTNRAPGGGDEGTAVPQ